MKVAQFASFGSPGKVIECVEVPNLNDPKDNELLLDIRYINYLYISMT